MSLAGSGGHDGSDSSPVRTVFKDAALVGAVVVIEGFESVMAPQSRHQGGQGSALSLDQLIFEMDRFRGVVVVIVTSRSSFSNVCHNIDPDLLRKFKLVLDYEQPTPAQRSKLWALMIPDKCPRADDIDFGYLGEKFAFTGGQISRVVYRAAARAAIRPVHVAQGASAGSVRGGGDATPDSAVAGGAGCLQGGAQTAVIHMQDLEAAAHDEEQKTDGDVAKMVANWFL